jgi:hypothetical protein
MDATVNPEVEVPASTSDATETAVISAPAEAEAPTAESSTATSTRADQKRTDPKPAAAPTQSGPHGIQFDFNHRARVILPPRTAGKWRIRLHDLDTGNTLLMTENQGAFVRSAKRYDIRIGIGGCSWTTPAPRPRC